MSRLYVLRLLVTDATQIASLKDFHDLTVGRKTSVRILLFLSLINVVRKAEQDNTYGGAGWLQLAFRAVLSPTPRIERASLNESILLG